MAKTGKVGMSIDYNELDPKIPKIRETVRWLRDHGFETTDSGDGVSKAGTEQSDTMLAFPHVVIRTEPDHLVYDAHELYRVLKALGVSFEPEPAVQRFPGIEATYSPIDGVATIMLTDIDDADMKLGADDAH